MVVFDEQHARAHGRSPVSWLAICARLSSERFAFTRYPLTPSRSVSLRAGDVVTLEPGLYIEGVGGLRIENNFLITVGSHERLSNHVISLV